MDQGWLGPELAAKQTGAFIERRSNVSGAGSDHDPLESPWISENCEEPQGFSRTKRVCAIA
jgi:hypothetical protein